jgi:hypothetical protein
MGMLTSAALHIVSPCFFEAHEAAFTTHRARFVLPTLLRGSAVCTAIYQANYSVMLTIEAVRQEEAEIEAEDMRLLNAALTALVNKQ